MDRSDPLPGFKLTDTTIDRISRVLLEEAYDLITYPLVLQANLEPEDKKAYGALTEAERTLLQYRVLVGILEETYERARRIMQTPPPNHKQH